MADTATQTAPQNKALQVLHDNVEKLRSSEQWKAALDVRAKLHNYSFNNVMLIALQCPDATMIAGYRKWQELGRQVRKGEKSIAILAPLVKTIKDEDTGEKVRRVVGFRAASVFDVSQTEGEELPTFPRPEILDGHDETAEAVYARLCEYAAGIGSPVEVVGADKLGSAQGAYHLASKKITIRDDLPPLQRMKTTIHEIAHAMLHGEDSSNDIALFELEAESCAYLVCDALGIDTGSFSFNYIARWTGDTEKLLKSGDRAVKAATALTEALTLTTPEVAS